MKATDSDVPTKEQFIALVERYIGTRGTQYTLIDNTDGSVVYNVVQDIATSFRRVQYSSSYHKRWHFYSRDRMHGAIMSGCGNSLAEAIDESGQE